MTTEGTFSVVISSFGVCAVWLERTLRRTEGLGAGVEGQEIVSFSETAVWGRGRECLCQALASPAAWGSLIRHHAEGTPACVAEAARGWCWQLPTAGLTAHWHSLPAFSSEMVV